MLRSGVRSVLSIGCATSLALACGGAIAPVDEHAEGTAPTSCEGTTVAGDAVETEASAELSPELAACDGPGSCEIASAGCCPDYTGARLVAIGKGQRDRLHAVTCDDPAPTCSGCAAGSALAHQAWCRDGRCVRIDLDLDPMSACVEDDDCVLRPFSCCSCDPIWLVAVRKDRRCAYDAAICPRGVTCAPCGPRDAAVRAVCDPTTRHCAVRR